MFEVNIQKSSRDQKVGTRQFGQVVAVVEPHIAIGA